MFNDLLPPISWEQVKALEWDLDIDKYELNRTRWALKDVDQFDGTHPVRIAGRGVRSRGSGRFEDAAWGENRPMRAGGSVANLAKG